MKKSYFIVVLFSIGGLLWADTRPNIILMIADDMSMKDWATYGNTFAKTPNIDAMARQGLKFNNAFCGSPVCHPARSVLLTGQEIWRLRDAALFGGTLHKDITTYVDLLGKAGYDVAYSGKGWGPGALSPGGRTSPPTGRRSSLAAVLRQDGKLPFCFWWGTTLGHRELKYRPDGRSLDAITLPPYIPDTPAVRQDYAGYYQEVEAFDTEVGKVMQQLDKAGVADSIRIKEPAKSIDMASDIQNDRLRIWSVSDIVYHNYRLSPDKIYNLLAESKLSSEDQSKVIKVITKYYKLH